MRTIWKYTLAHDCILKMPYDAQILSVQVQNGMPQLWALVDSDAKLEERHFVIYGTGHEIKTSEVDQRYIGTFQLLSGGLVFHVFEEDLR